jgi:hypothetical protein
MAVVHDGKMSNDYIEAEDNKMQPTLFLSWVRHHRTLPQDHLSSSSSNSSASDARDYIHPHIISKTPPVNTWNSTKQRECIVGTSQPWKNED